MRSLWELDLGVGLLGRMRDEMLAGKEAKVLAGRGGGGAGKAGKKGESLGVVGEDDEKGSFGF